MLKKRDIGGILRGKTKNALMVFNRKGLISLERETGFEPATFSLGSYRPTIPGNPRQSSKKAINY